METAQCSINLGPFLGLLLDKKDLIFKGLQKNDCKACTGKQMRLFTVECNQNHTMKIQDFLVEFQKKNLNAKITNLRT